MDRNNNQELATPKPTRRMDKIRRSLSFRRKKKDKNGTKSQQPSQFMLEPQIPSSASYSSGTTNNNSSAISSNLFTGTTSIALPGNSASAAAAAAPSAANAKTSNTTTNADSPVRPPLWIEDERKVRAGNCSFQVKYLGFQEVTDSRGMHICEMAIEKLLAVSQNINFFLFKLKTHTHF